MGGVGAAALTIAAFQTEAFFAKHEFQVPFLLCASDVEALSVADLLALADVSTSELTSLRLGYTETNGHRELREAIAAGYEQVDPDHVVFLGAPVEGVFVTAHALLEPGDHVIVPAPCYDALANVAEYLVGKDNVDRWAVRAAGDHWHIDLDELESMITPKTRALFVNFPHNATGYLPTADEWTRLVEIAQTHELWVFSDEMYRGLELTREPLPSMAGMYPRSVVLSGLSKGFGLAGLRAGWLVVPDARLRHAILNWKFYTTICATQTSEFLARVALGIRDKLLNRSLEIIRGNLDVARPFFNAHADEFTFREPMAGSVALVELTGGSATERCRQWQESFGVLLLPGPNLGAGDNFVRFGFGRTNFAEGLRHLDEPA